MICVLLLLLASTAHGQDAKAKPAAAEYATGLKVPDDLRQRLKVSWDRHGARMMTLPKVLAAKWDAADFGMDSPVDDQGGCGSCHLFAGTGAVECAQLKEGHKGITLSKQQVMDCAGTGDCNGGWPEDTCAYAKKIGLATTKDYGPYRERRQACKSVASMKLYKLKDYGYVTREDGVPSYQELKDAMAKYGPLIVCVSADNRFMNADPGKVFSGNAGSINHAVMLTGWDDNKDGGPALKMKNSWSAQWGVNGYLWMRPGANRIGYGAMWCVAEDTLPDPVPPGPTPPDPPIPPIPPTPGKVGRMTLEFPGMPKKVYELHEEGTQNRLDKLDAIRRLLDELKQPEPKPAPEPPKSPCWCPKECYWPVGSVLCPSGHTVNWQGREYRAVDFSKGKEPPTSRFWRAL